MNGGIKAKLSILANRDIFPLTWDVIDQLETRGEFDACDSMSDAYDVINKEIPNADVSQHDDIEATFKIWETQLVRKETKGDAPPQTLPN